MAYNLDIDAMILNEKSVSGVKSALLESKKLLDFYIESIDDLEEEQFESVKHFIKALRSGCGCDDYNDFDCGCGKRAFLCDKALEEVRKDFTYGQGNNC